MIAYCGQCGAQARPGVKHCGQCGQPVTAAPEVITAVPRAPQPPAAYAEPLPPRAEAPARAQPTPDFTEQLSWDADTVLRPATDDFRFPAGYEAPAAPPDRGELPPWHESPRNRAPEPVLPMRETPQPPPGPVFPTAAPHRGMPSSIPAPMPTPLPAPPARRPWVVPLVATVVVVAIGAVVALFVVNRNQSAPATSQATVTVRQTVPAPAAAPQPTPAPATPTPSPSPSTPGVNSDDAARQQLAQRRGESLVGFSPQGQWIVQLASKWHGIQDPSQLAANGTHVFFVSDILAEHEALLNRFGGAVRLLSSTDLGKQVTYPNKPAGELLWVTVYDPGTFGSKEGANAWCARAYPGLTGDALKNVCFAKQALPPHS